MDVKEKVEGEMLLGKNLEMAKLLGFQDQQIARVLTKRFKEHKNNFATFYDFMQKVMEEPEVDVESKLAMKRAKAILDEVKCTRCKKEKRLFYTYNAHTFQSVLRAPEKRACARFAVTS